MSIEIKLFGFGDDRPAAFNHQNQVRLEIETPATPWAVLRAVGIDDATGLVLMNRDQVIPAPQWHDSLVHDQDKLTLLAAFEGG